MKAYRRIWEDAYGPIPVDKEGRSYEIHHIDGDRGNNRLENLKCVSIVEHYLIHLRQGDMLAAAAIARRLGITSADMQLLNSAAGREARDKAAGFHGLPEAQKLANASLGGKGNKGKRWFNDGQESRRCRVCPGPQWVAGRLPCGSGMKRGTRLGDFWNKDGVNIRSMLCPGEGWSRGRFLTDEQRQRRREIASRRRSK